MKRFVQFALVSGVSLVTGYLIGARNSVIVLEHQEISNLRAFSKGSPPATLASKQPASNAEVGEKSTDKESPNLVKIPETLLQMVSKFHLSSNGLGVDPIALAPFGLSREEGIKLINTINTQIETIAIEEARNSKLIKSSDGGEFYRISSFPEKGKAIREQVERSINDAFLSFTR